MSELREWHVLNRGPAAMTDRTCDCCHRPATEYVGFFTNFALRYECGTVVRTELKPKHVFSCEHHVRVIRVGQDRLPWPSPPLVDSQ